MTDATAKALREMANNLASGDWTAMDLEDNEVSHKIVNALREAAATIERLHSAHEEVVRLRRPITIAVEDASQFLISKGYKDTLTFSAITVVDLLCEFRAAEREKFTMHTAHVHAWFSALLQELGIAKEGDQTDVATACSKAMDEVARLRAQSASGRREGIEMAAKRAEAVGFDVMPDQLTEEVCKISAAIRALSSAPPGESAPIDMVLFCPRCHLQHVDRIETALVWTGGSAPEPSHEEVSWGNPPHKSHLCHGCDLIWRPADVTTNGVAAIKTRGSHDSDFVPPPEKGERIPSGEDAALDLNKFVVTGPCGGNFCVWINPSECYPYIWGFAKEYQAEQLAKAIRADLARARLRLAASPPPAKAEDGIPYNSLIADEIRAIALSAGGGDSATGLLILGLLDQYETRIGGPRATSKPGDRQ